jgi:hypothetical protein
MEEQQAREILIACFQVLIYRNTKAFEKYWISYLNIIIFP